MSSGPNTRSMIFTLFGDYIRHYGDEIWIGTLIKLLQEFGHNEQSVRAAVSRMYKQGWLESQKEGNKSYYRLTGRGKERMAEAGQRIFKLHPEQWDGKWRMLFYSIPEQKRKFRDDLKKELEWSGYAPLSPGCWISPNDLTKGTAALVKNYGIEPYVHLFTAEYEGPGENEDMVQRCWDLGELAERYKSFLRVYGLKLEEMKENIAAGRAGEAECFVEKAMLVHEYRKFLFIDPGLPAELLPADWAGNEAFKLFSAYYEILAEPAVSFYEGVFAEGNQLDKGDRDGEVLRHPFIETEAEGAKVHE